MPTARQIEAARSLLGWKQTDLAAASGLSVSTVKNVERGAYRSQGASIAAIERAMTAAGIAFSPDGVAMRASSAA